MDMPAATAGSSRAAAPPAQGQPSRKEAARHVANLTAQLAEAVGASVRRVFQRQQLHAQSSIADIRQQLPELSQFLSSVRSAPARRLKLMRRVFGAASASWLSRSARQSGVSALLGRQLVQLAADADAQGDSAAPAIARFVARVLLDALFTSCSTRLGVHCRACEWRGRKPKYYTMDCALVWHTLLPVVASLALQWPEQLADVMDAHFAALRPQRMRVNCVFAQVSGVWTLIERLHTTLAEDASSSVGSPGAPPVEDHRVVRLMQRLIQFLVRAKLLGAHQASATEPETERRSDGVPDFDDLLMQKFFAELQGFTFSCSRSREVVGPALEAALTSALVRATGSGDAFNGVFVAKLSVLVGLSCISVKGHAEFVVSTILRECRARQEAIDDGKTPRRLLLQLAVGFAAHFDLVGLSSVLDVLAFLLDCYCENKQDQLSRAESAVFIVYVAVHRREALQALQSGTGSTTWRSHVRDKLLDFLDRVCGQVDPLAFRSLPIQWMAVFWKDWVGMTDEDVVAFQEHCSSSAVADEIESDEASDASAWHWMKSTDSLPFRSCGATFAACSTHVRPHWIPLHDLDPTVKLSKPSMKRKAMRRSNKDGRSAKRIERELDPEQEERKLSVLLLPDIMERICSFMSAKRLRRLASVCKYFAEVSRRDSLWRPLWFKLASQEPETPVCTHGALFQHNWIGMYWARTKARRRVRQKQKRLAGAGNSRVAVVSDDEDEASTADGEPILQICPHCDCNVVLTTTTQAVRHMAAHKLYSCEKAGCGASFSSALKFKAHGRKAHPVRKHPTKALPSPTLAQEEVNKPKKEKKEKTCVPCSFDGCDKTYVSMKRLETHRKTLEHYLQRP